MTHWELLASAWLLAGMLTLSIMDRHERDEGGDGRFKPLNFANVMTIVAVLLFWPIVVVGAKVAEWRGSRGGDEDSVIWKVTLIIVAPFLIPFVPLLVLAVIFGLTKRLIRRIRGIAPPEPPRLLRVPSWPQPEEETALLGALAETGGSSIEPGPDSPEARLLEIAWVYVGLRLTGMPEDEVFRRLEMSRGATHFSHPKDLRDYLQWRLQQDDPGGPKVDPAAFPRVASQAVNLVCDRYEAALQVEFEPPDGLVELAAPETATPRKAEATLLRLVMDEGDELYRFMGDSTSNGAIMIIRGGCAVAHLRLPATALPVPA